MGSRRVVITGHGVVSSLGLDTHASWRKLLAKSCGIRTMESPDFDGLPCRIAGAVDEPLLQARAAEVIPSADRKTMSRATIFSLLAAEEALNQARWRPEGAAERESTGVSVGVSLDGTQEIFDTALQVRDRGPRRGVGPFFLLRILSNMAAAHISIRYRLSGPQMALSTACATGAQAIGDGYRAIKGGIAKVMVCGASEAPINPLMLAAFSKIRSLATQFECPTEASRPFDAARSGFVFGEGAGVMVLEDLDHALARGATPLAEVLGFGSSGDAHHLTAPHPDGGGALRCMRAALDDAKLTPADVGLINAHATSTPLGDAAESKAIAELTSQLAAPVMVTSNKGAIGHLLGACGAVEGIFTALSCSEGVVPVTLNLSRPQTGFDLDYVMAENRAWRRDGGRRIALSNSFGFGGVNATLCIGEVA